MTVSELVLKASNTLVAEFGTIVVEGEVSSFHHHRPSGHMYWTLKDRASEVRSVMFRRDNEKLGFELSDGSQVIVVARPTIYRARGQFQLEITEVVPQGRGALFLKFQALKEQLAKEGLFEAERKQELPFWPQRVGVVTSADGAAFRDIVTVLRRRAPATEILLRAVPVQGREAAPEIARAIRWFSDRQEADVLIVGRGGGSLEDLWAFNEEAVVRAIVDCRVPLVSAVGHESDTSLSDLAADLRAATPSAAAEHVVPETQEIARTVESAGRRLIKALDRQRKQRIDKALAPIRRYGFRRVRDRSFESRQRWAESTNRLAVPVSQSIQASRMRLQGGHAALVGPTSKRIALASAGLERSVSVGRTISHRSARVRARFDHVVERLEGMSPLSILDRGYAIVTAASGSIARDAADLESGEVIEVRLARGKATAEVLRTENSSIAKRKGRP